ncbi:hypothetical protein KFL_010060035 [Klebsormidium nitens]|uniref:Bacteriophage/plasmid primase P4 C-terminal domain-containing protein n=1 Tax=Klebsormidium nitens TaxID=105231 RepID=A0A1Y1IND8_KLENI|nr:hypothetical protein KFL_010060035 [Klebsormidium nitens]|eukprot:GAQ92400.1 hypothetical protein KFL_010060035 [Klebsormidium nitens]
MASSGVVREANPVSTMCWLQHKMGGKLQHACQTCWHPQETAEHGTLQLLWPLVAQTGIGKSWRCAAALGSLFKSGGAHWYLLACNYRLTMAPSEPSSPDYSSSRAPKEEEGSTKRPASRKRERDITKELPVQSTVSSSKQRLEGMQARDGPEDGQHASTDQSQGSALAVQMPSEEGGSGRKTWRRLVKLSELASGDALDPTAGSMAELAPHDGIERQTIWMTTLESHPTGPRAACDGPSRARWRKEIVDRRRRRNANGQKRTLSQRTRLLGRLVERLLKLIAKVPGGCSPEVGGRLPPSSAHTADEKDEVEIGGDGGAPLCAGPKSDGVADASGGSPRASAHTADPVNEHPVVGHILLRVAVRALADRTDSMDTCFSYQPPLVTPTLSRAAEGGGSPSAKMRSEDRADGMESDGAGDAESNAETSCDSGPVTIGAAAHRSCKLGSPEVSRATREPDLANVELQTEVVRELEKLLSTWGDSTSVFCGAKPSSTGIGVIYEFRNAPGGRVTCPYFAATCEGVHGSDAFGLLRQGVEVTYVCYAESCEATAQSGNISLGVLPLPIAAAFGDSQPLNSERNHLYSDRQLLPLPFLRENLNIRKGDVGGAVILERLYVRTGLKFAFTSSGSYYWTGRSWAKDESGGRILRVLREELSKIEAEYIREAKEGGGGGVSIAVADGSRGDEDGGWGAIKSKPAGGGKKRKTEREERLINVNFNAKMSNIIGTCKDYFYQPGFQSLLDVQKDFLAVANGVIDLADRRAASASPSGEGWICARVQKNADQLRDFGRKFVFMEALAKSTGVRSKTVRSS